MKKAQTEILGLAIVIILLILGAIFAIKFLINREPVEYKKSFTQTEIASNMLNTFLKTRSMDCNDLSMSELLQDCGDVRIISCNGKFSCDYVEENTGIIFDKTLESWNYDYEFKVFHQENNPLIVLGNPCQGNKESKLFPLPTRSGTLSVKLEVCG